MYLRFGWPRASILSGRLTNRSCLTRHRAPHCENVVRMEYAPRAPPAATAARPVKPRPGARRARGWVYMTESTELQCLK